MEASGPIGSQRLARLPRPLLPGVGDNRVVEFAVVQHLGPEASVHEVADMLDELPVQVWGDGRAGFAGIDSRDHRRRGGASGLSRSAEGQKSRRGLPLRR